MPSAPVTLSRPCSMSGYSSRPIPRLLPARSRRFIHWEGWERRATSRRLLRSWQGHPLHGLRERCWWWTAGLRFALTRKIRLRLHFTQSDSGDPLLLPYSQFGGKSSWTSDWPGQCKERSETRHRAYDMKARERTLPHSLACACREACRPRRSGPRLERAFGQTPSTSPRRRPRAKFLPRPSLFQREVPRRLPVHRSRSERHESIQSSVCCRWKGPAEARPRWRAFLPVPTVHRDGCPETALPPTCAVRSNARRRWLP